MKKVEVILKVTDTCNLRCAYCYNSEKGYKNNRVTLEQFEKLLTLLLTDYNFIHIIWHGGEPLCAGLSFFKEAMNVERKISMRSSVTIENSIQTNGTLINSEWASFFKKHGFRVGISFDGVHNEKYRQQTEKTLQGMEKLKAAGLDFSCLAVVADEAYDLEENYRFFAEKKIAFDFSPMFSEGAAKDMPKMQTVKYANDCIALFDKWLYDTNGVSVRTFAYYMNMALGGNSRICSCASCHGKYICLSADGTLYNCGRDGVSAYPFGNIESVQSVKEMLSSEGAIRLLKGSVERRKKCKESCEYFQLCQGGCADIAIMENGLENIPVNHCYLFKTLYKHISEKIKKIVDDQVPLDTLNPTVKKVLAKSLTRMGGPMQNEIADGYVK